MRIKIAQKGWEGFNGVLGPIQFTNGISADITQREADRLGVMMRVVEVDENDVELGVVSANAELIRTSHIRMEVVDARQTVAEKEAANPTPPVTEPEITPPNPMPQPEPAPVKDYTREELEKIADDNGIKGLRDIGTPLGAKNTSISKLIEEILVAQEKRAKAKG